MELAVNNNLNQQQFEVQADGELAVLQYRFHDKLLWLMHTDVPKSWKAMGLLLCWHIPPLNGPRRQILK